jgi:hypothetical protein
VATRRLKGSRPRGERGLGQGLWGKPSWWGLRLPAIGATMMFPRPCCAGVKWREAVRSCGLRVVTHPGTGRTAGLASAACPGEVRPARIPPGWGRIRAWKWPRVGEPSRFGGGRPPALRPWFARGRGEPMKIGGTSTRLAAGFSETGSVARRTLEAKCCELVNLILTTVKRAALSTFSLSDDSSRFTTTLKHRAAGTHAGDSPADVSPTAARAACRLRHLGRRATRGVRLRRRRRHRA